MKLEYEKKIEKCKRNIEKGEEENRFLIKKIKTLEQENEKISLANEEYKSRIEVSEEFKDENLDLRRKFEDTLSFIEDLQQRYENLVMSSMAFEEKTRELYNTNQALQENILKLLP